MRAGNAGAVFVKSGDKMYGPVGNPGSVVRDVALGRESVMENIALATDVLQDTLAPPLNLDELQLRNIGDAGTLASPSGN